ncbi:hypothetical protein QUA94_02400 [Microcoleus sp. F8-D2]
MQINLRFLKSKSVLPKIFSSIFVTQSEKEWVKSQLKSWKQTAEEMQIELERSRSKLKQAQSQLERSAFPLGKS